MCVITGARHYSIDLPQGGLEIPCNYIFRTNNRAESDKAKKLIETVLKITIEPASEDEPTSLEVQTSKHTDDTSRLTETPAVTTPMHTTNTDPQIQCSHSLTESIPVIINEETSNEPPPKKRKLSEIDIEGIIMGEELCDVDINLAQTLLWGQFPELGGLQSTFLQQKEAPILEKKKMLQIIHCPSRHHWIVQPLLETMGTVVKFLSMIPSSRKLTEKQRRLFTTSFNCYQSVMSKLSKHKSKWVQKTVGCLP